MEAIKLEHTYSSFHHCFFGNFTKLLLFGGEKAHFLWPKRVQAVCREQECFRPSYPTAIPVRTEHMTPINNQGVKDDHKLDVEKQKSHSRGVAYFLGKFPRNLDF